MHIKLGFSLKSTRVVWVPNHFPLCYSDDAELSGTGIRCICAECRLNLQRAEVSPNFVSRNTAGGKFGTPVCPAIAELTAGIV
jgi:hypothetical protein